MGNSCVPAQCCGFLPELIRGAYSQRTPGAVASSNSKLPRPDVCLDEICLEILGLETLDIVLEAVS